MGEGITPVQQLSDGGGRGNDKVLDVCGSLKHFEMSPKASSAHLHLRICLCGKYMFVGSNSVFHHALIQLACQIWAFGVALRGNLMSARHYKTRLKTSVVYITDDLMGNLVQNCQRDFFY